MAGIACFHTWMEGCTHNLQLDHHIRAHPLSAQQRSSLSLKQESHTQLALANTWISLPQLLCFLPPCPACSLRWLWIDFCYWNRNPSIPAAIPLLFSITYQSKPLISVSSYGVAEARTHSTSNTRTNNARAWGGVQRTASNRRLHAGGRCTLIRFVRAASRSSWMSFG